MFSLPCDDLTAVQVSAADNVSRHVNQPDTIGQGSTPLHYAARLNNIDALKILIDNMADMEKVNCYHGTPLHNAAAFGSKEAAEHLIRCGARLDARTARFETPFTLACMARHWRLAEIIAEKHSQNMEPDCFGQNALYMISKAQAERKGQDSALQLFHRLLDVDEGVSLHHKDIYSITAAHWMLSEPSASLFCSLLNRDARLFRAELIEWAGSLLFSFAQYPLKALSAIAENLQVLRRYHSKDEMRRIADLAIPGRHNLFCNAARWGLSEAVSHFYLLGADINQQCEQHGAPLAAAFLRNHLTTVRWLVRHGANVPDNLLSQREGEPMPPSDSSEVVRWLLVGRHLEQRKIENDGPWEQESMANWSGIVKAKVPLRWEWKQANRETMIQYAARRQKIVWELRGQIVRVE